MNKWNKFPKTNSKSNPRYGIALCRVGEPDICIKWANKEGNKLDGVEPDRVRD